MVHSDSAKICFNDERITVFRQIDHDYGPQVRILNDPYSLSLLATLSDKKTTQPNINLLIKMLYRVLFHAAVAEHFPICLSEVETRLIDVNPEAVWQGPIADKSTPAVVVAMARAGLIPADIFFENLNVVLDAQNVRQDHFMINRTANNTGGVTGAVISGCKIGGSIDDAIVLIPDPMGATGSSILEVLKYYEENKLGSPKKIVLLHLVVSPEYLRSILDRHPTAHIISLRLDRGLSPEEVLREKPGKKWLEEKGLNDNHYIVPGIGGLGEMMNNSWV